MITKMIYVDYTNGDALVSNCGNTIPKRFADEKKTHQEYHQLDATNRYFHSQCAYYKIAMTIKNWLHIVYSWPTMNFYSKHYKHIVGMKKSIQLYKKCWKIRIKMLSSRKNNAATEENCSFPPCIVKFVFLHSLEY